MLIPVLIIKLSEDRRHTCIIYANLNFSVEMFSCLMVTNLTRKKNTAVQFVLCQVLSVKANGISVDQGLYLQCAIGGMNWLWGCHYFLSLPYVLMRL